MGLAATLFVSSIRALRFRLLFQSALGQHITSQLKARGGGGREGGGRAERLRRWQSDLEKKGEMPYEAGGS